MTSDDFVGYVGDPDFHDGVIMRVVADEHTACVIVRGASGKKYAVEFYGVKAVRSNKPEGMIIYAMIEMKTFAPTRHFVFPNWDDDNDASLESEAEGFNMTSCQ